MLCAAPYADINADVSTRSRVLAMLAQDVATVADPAEADVADRLAELNK